MTFFESKNELKLVPYLCGTMVGYTKSSCKCDWISFNLFFLPLTVLNYILVSRVDSASQSNSSLVARLVFLFSKIQHF